MAEILEVIARCQRWFAGTADGTSCSKKRKCTIVEVAIIIGLIGCGYFLFLSSYLVAQSDASANSQNQSQTSARPAYSGPTGTLAGKLTDQHARPMGGTEMTARNLETGDEARTITEENGNYSFTGLEPGEYRITADSKELGHGEVEGIIVTGGHQARVVVALNMELPAVKPLPVTIYDLTPTTTVLQTKLPAEEMQQMPLTGRNWGNFVLETPQATPPSENPQPKGMDTTGLNPGATIEKSGLRAAGALNASMAIDGMNTTPGFKARGWGRGGSSPMAEAAISEVKTQAGNGEVMASRAGAGEISAHTARGTNGLHGKAFVYDRGSLFSAMNPFTEWVKETAPATSTTIPVFAPFAYTPEDQEMTLGLGIGGRIRKNKIFWFAALDGYMRNNPGVSSLRHEDMFFTQPTDAQMTLLALQLGLPTTNPVVEGIGAYSSLLETLDGLLGPAARSARQWIGFGRVDWQQNERNHWMAEGNGARWHAPGGTLTRTAETFGNHSFGISKVNNEWGLLRWERFWSENLLSVTQGSWSREVLSQLPGTPSTFEQSLMINVWGQLPQIVVDSRYGYKIGNPARLGPGPYPDERRIQGGEQIDWVHRQHLLKAGFVLGHIEDEIGVLLNQTGTYSYSSVEDFASDALVFEKYGIEGQLNPYDQHNCNPTHKTSFGGPSLGYLPCYSYYSQTMGPVGWSLSTNDMSAYVTEQWQLRKHLTVSMALRWEHEELPPAIKRLVNPDFPLTAKLPALGDDWGPRVSIAWAIGGKYWPVFRAGYGMYYGRTENATVETVLTHTGSINGDLNFFFRPTDNLHGGGAPPFPYVFAGEPLNLVKPGAVMFAEKFKNPEVHQALVALDESLPGHVQLTASALLSLGRRLPTSIDTNIDPTVNPGTITFAVVDGDGKGPIKAPLINVPFYAAWPFAACPSGALLNLAGQCGRINPNYQQITKVESKANSTYEALMLRVSRYGRRGLSLHAYYTYSHAMDWNPNETTLVAGSDVLDPQDFSLEYGTSDLDVRHVGGGSIQWTSPWRLKGLAGKFANAWMLSTVGLYRSGMPFTMRTVGSLATCVPPGDFCMPIQPGSGNVPGGTAVAGLGPSENGSGGDNRIYGVGSDKVVYNIGRNTYRYPATWKADVRVGKKIELGKLWELELLAESFNLFNNQNVTEIETVGYSMRSGTSSGLPTLNFLTGLKPNTTAFGQPLDVSATNFFRPRQFEFGMRMRF